MAKQAACHGGRHPAIAPRRPWIGVPIELVSKFMRHTDTRATERIYASVQRRHLVDRMLDVIDTLLSGGQ
jgi:hypothetical protein